MKAPTSRRSFLKASAAVAASAPLASLAQSASGESLRVGMIGCGGRCTGAGINAMNAGPDVRLVALSDIFPERVENAYKSLKKQRPAQVDAPPERRFVGFDGYRKVIDASDVVLIACASKFHPRYALAALEAGKHVFVEKPHGVDPAGMHVMRRAMEVAREKKLCLLSGLMSRYSSAFQEGVKRIHDGEIGEVVSIEENFLRAPYGLHKREASFTEMMYQFRNWYHFSWLSGDDVTQSLVHNMDRARAVLKDTVPLWCYGLGGRSSMFTEQMGDMFDHHTVTYEFPGGVKVFAHCRTQTGCYNNSHSIVLGSKGRAILSSHSFSIFDREGRRTASGKAPVSPFDAEHRALFDAVRQGKSLVSEYMADSTLTTVMGQIACYTGQKVTWEEALASNVHFGPEDGNFDSTPPKTPGPDGLYPIPVPGKTRIL